MTRNADPDKYSYYQFGKEAMIFGADNSPYLCAYNYGLDDTTIIAGAEFSISFSEKDKKISLSLHYNRSNSFLFVNGIKIYPFKAKKIRNKYISILFG